MEISIISDFQQLISFITEYKRLIDAGDFGYNNARLVKMPNIYETLNKWEEKNISALEEPYQKEQFYNLKLRVERLMVEHNINPPDSFYHVGKGEWIKGSVNPVSYNAE
ncbi:MAG: hypothetical protein WAQ28_02065 [Bacteroidia bacterium]